MLDVRSTSAGQRLRITALTADGAFEQLLRTTFAANTRVDLDLHQGSIADHAGKLELRGATLLVVDLDAGRQEDLQALQGLAARLVGSPPILVVTQGFSEAVARRLLQIRIADFLVKPVEPIELERACFRAASGPAAEAATEAHITTFLPASGGVGVTTLAIETAMQLVRRAPRGAASVCLVDLDFQHGACADYLDIEPRLDVGEIEPQPERLDAQLLEVMLSHHASGLALIAAPSRPAEMRSFDPDVVTRLLDMVSTRFDYVVIDMPRTWFAWTDSVLFGSNRLFIVTEMTVPGLRHAKQLVAAIGERLKGGPEPRVIVNRFEQRLFGAGLRRSDIEKTLGETFAGVIPNNYRCVREAIDRGVPLDEVKAGNNVAGALKRILFPQGGAKSKAKRPPAATDRGRAFAWMR